MRVLLKDLAPGTKYAVQFRAYNGDGYSDWSQIMYFDTTGDTMPPAAVENLTWTVTGGTFTAGWNKVVFNKDGSLLNDFRDYQVTISDGDPNTAKVFSSTSESFSFPLDLNQNTFGRIMPTLTITVRARDYSGNLADPVSLTCTDPKPAKPTTPAVSTYLGQLVVGWDGNGTNGYAMPYNFDHLDIYVSTDPDFVPSKDTLNQTIYSAAKVIISDLEYNTTYYVRFVAVNTIGGESDPSDVGSGAPSRISGLDIQDGAISVSQINFVDQIGGPAAFYQPTKPTTGMKAKDIWYDTSPAGAYQASVYDGTNWNIDNNIGVVSGTKILAGTVTADQIGANKIITSSANIGTAVIDNSNIGSLNAGKITAGVLQSGFNVTVDGTSRPAWSMDTAGVATFNSANIYGTITVGSSTNTAANNAKISMQSYNYLPGSAGWAVKGNGDIEFNSGVFRGTLTGNTINSAFINGGTINGTTITGVDISASSTIRGATITGGTIQTAQSGSRVQIDTTGLNLYNSSGQNTVSLSTSGTALVTGLYKSNYSGMRVEIDGSWTRANAANPNAPYSGIRMYGASGTWGEIGTGGDPQYSGLTTLQIISPGASGQGGGNGSFLRLRDDNTFSLFSNTQGNVSATTGLTLASSNSSVTISGTAINLNGTVNAGTIYANTYGTSGSTFNLSANAIYVRAYGGTMQFGQLARGTGTIGIQFGGELGINSVGAVFAVRNGSDSDVAPISCGYVYNTGGISVGSDVKLKTNIVVSSTEAMLNEIVNTDVYEYDINAGGVSNRTRGVMAHEVSSLILAPETEAVDHKSVDIYSLLATSVGAIKALHGTIETLKAEIASLKGNQ